MNGYNSMALFDVVKWDVNQREFCHKFPSQAGWTSLNSIIRNDSTTFLGIEQTYRKCFGGSDVDKPHHRVVLITSKVCGESFYKRNRRVAHIFYMFTISHY